MKYSSLSCRNRDKLIKKSKPDLMLYPRSESDLNFRNTVVIKNVDANRMQIECKLNASKFKEISTCKNNFKPKYIYLYL